jgi:hypothetical protein
MPGKETQDIAGMSYDILIYLYKVYMRICRYRRRFGELADKRFLALENSIRVNGNLSAVGQLHDQTEFQAKSRRASNVLARVQGDRTERRGYRG